MPSSLTTLRESRSQTETHQLVHGQMRVPGSARQTTCRDDGGKRAVRSVEIDWLAPASCSKANGSPAPTPPRSLGSVCDEPNGGSSPRRWSLPSCYGSTRANNATENAVPFPPQKKTSRDFLRVELYRSSPFGLLLSSARLARRRLRSRFASGNRQNSSGG